MQKRQSAKPNLQTNPPNEILVDVKDADAAGILDEKGEALEEFSSEQGVLPQEDIYEDKLNDTGQETAEGLVAEMKPERPVEIHSTAVQDPSKKHNHKI